MQTLDADSPSSVMCLFEKEKKSALTVITTPRYVFVDSNYDTYLNSRQRANAVS